MINVEWVKPTLHFFTDGICKLEILPNGTKHITIDISDEEKNQVGFELLEGEHK